MSNASIGINNRYIVGEGVDDVGAGMDFTGDVEIIRWGDGELLGTDILTANNKGEDDDRQDDDLFLRCFHLQTSSSPFYRDKIMKLFFP